MGWVLLDNGCIGVRYSCYQREGERERARPVWLMYLFGDTCMNSAMCNAFRVLEQLLKKIASRGHGLHDTCMTSPVKENIEHR